jgi:hypothetical protein
VEIIDNLIAKSARAVTEAVDAMVLEMLAANNVEKPYTRESILAQGYTLVMETSPMRETKYKLMRGDETVDERTISFSTKLDI